MLTEFEQLALLAVMRVGEDAYGVPVHAEIRRCTSRDLSVASVYKTLERLQDKGFVTGRVGPPTPERGGRAKRFYTVTNTGRAQLRKSLASIRRLAEGLGVGFEPS